MSSPVSTKIFQNFRSDYDTKFTADISRQMHMPDRLGAVNNLYDPLSQQSNYDPFISNFGKPQYVMAEPPQVLTLHDHHTFMSSDEDEDANADAASNEDPPGSYVHEEDYPTPQKSKFLRDADIDVPMTPGSMLLLEKGDEMAVIRRQVSKLTRQVARLQEENSRRRNREFILFPVVIGYCLIHLVRMILRSK